MTPNWPLFQKVDFKIHLHILYKGKFTQNGASAVDIVPNFYTKTCIYTYNVSENYTCILGHVSVPNGYIIPRGARVSAWKLYETSAIVELPLLYLAHKLLIINKRVAKSIKLQPWKFQSETLIIKVLELWLLESRFSLC